VKFQLSLQTKAANNLFEDDGDLWFAYTQTAYWQISNEDISFPFRETNHEPQVHVSFVADYPLLGFTGRSISVGVVHQSNGQARPLSRTWNRLFAEFQFIRGGYFLTFKPWAWIKDDESEDGNPDIEDYFGQYELRASYAHKGHLYRLMLRNVFDHEQRYNAELNWSYPISGRLRGFAQWYSGYGESLVDYNYKQDRIGRGAV
jgi:phospholipase A1